MSTPAPYTPWTAAVYRNNEPRTVAELLPSGTLRVDWPGLAELAAVYPLSPETTDAASSAIIHALLAMHKGAVEPFPRPTNSSPPTSSSLPTAKPQATTPAAMSPTAHTEPTLAEELEAEAAPEQITHCTISAQRDGYTSGPLPILSWQEARPHLDYQYDSGYGAVDCHAVYAWTPSRVLFISQYDGSTHVTSVPRHPYVDFSMLPRDGGDTRHD